MRPSPINLRPRAFPALLDRNDEFASVKTALQNSTPVSIYGEEGIGKSSFVRQLAHLPEVENFPDGVAWLDAAGYGLDDLLQTLFDVFCESIPEFKPRNAEIYIALQERTPIIFLDSLNLSLDEVISVLSAVPSFTFVLTSVKRSLWGEGKIIALQGLPEPEALALFEREWGHSMNEEEQAAARKICVLLKGHPLRILQSASLILEKSQTIGEILDELQRNVPEKVLLQTSLNTLTEHQKSVLILLAAAGGFVMLLEHLVSLTDEPNVRETLQGLIALGLVQAHSPRYSLTGDLALSLATLWDISSGEDALLDYFISWLDGRPAQTLIEESAEALIHTVKKAGEKEQWTQVIRLGRALERSLILWKRWQAWADVLNLILKAARALGDRNMEAWALHQLGSRTMCLGQVDEARALLAEALNIRKAIKDKAGAKVTQHNLDVLLRGSGTSKGGKSGARPWFKGGGTLFIALLMAAAIAYVALSLTVPPESLPFPGFPIYLFPTAPPMPSYTPTSTKIVTLTPSRTPTPTKTLTLTPTRTPTITSTPTITASSTSSIPIFTLNTGGFCRTGPGTSYRDITAIPAGDTVEIIGRNADNSWYYILWKKFNVKCWISSSTGQESGDLAGLPEQAPPPNSPPPAPEPFIGPIHWDAFGDGYVWCHYGGYYENVLIYWDVPFDTSGIESYEVKLDVNPEGTWYTKIDEIVASSQTSFDITSLMANYCADTIWGYVRAKDRDGAWSEWGSTGPVMSQESP
jgi:hypothetical protein